MKKYIVRLALLLLPGLVLVGFGALYARSQRAVSTSSLADEPRGVTAIAVEQTSYRPSRRYVGTLQPWLLARLGPQMISAYVEDVRVRPGDRVKKGQVLATLDCRKASAASRSVALEARALETRQKALSNEAARIQKLLEGGYVSENEVEQKQARSATEQAHLLALRAQLVGKAIEAEDCVLRAPFDGEVSERSADPGAFVRPGGSLVVVLDRSTVRLVLEVPEGDHDAVAPGVSARIRLLSGAGELSGEVARRSPAADPGTRTIRVEMDIKDAERRLPVGTTAEVTVDVGEPAPALRVPVTAARVRGPRATLFTLEGSVARRVSAKVLGEVGGSLFLEPTPEVKALVVTEGRSLLSDGDRVIVKIEQQREAR